MKYILRYKASSADNQQERPNKEGWIVGFTDGEGCFSVSIVKNKTMRSGWQVFPEFVITQGKKSLPALEIFKEYFGCGKIFINKRYDNHHEHLYRFCIRSIDELQNNIVPFFIKNQLHTAKKKDFELFAEILDLMKKKKHLTQDGMRKIAKKIQRMNRKKPSKYLESSETIRQASV